MAEIRFTRKAVEDLSDIWNYAADVWLERLADTYNCSRGEFCLSCIDDRSFPAKIYRV